MKPLEFTGRSLVNGRASGEALKSDMPLSFWGGVDPDSGFVIDEHHPLHGQNVSGRVVLIPSGRGSCTGSGVLMELIDRELAPAALVFCEPEEILTLGAIVAQRMFNKHLPVVQISAELFKQLQTGDNLAVHNGSVTVQATATERTNWPAATQSTSAENTLADIILSTDDRALLDGTQGHATQVAMQIMLQMAQVQGATSLIDVTQAHIDACVYNGESGLQFAKKLLAWGAKFCIPTTLNSISVDQKRWRQQGIDESFGEPASLLGETYLQMGAQMSFTCAPYLLDTKPARGEQIVWAESNAVVYANSVLGARTQKYADFLDVCIALTGRAPDTGCHTQAGRLPDVSIHIQPPDTYHDEFWPLLGYHLGLATSNKLAIVYGLESTNPSSDDLKAFCAAFATTSAVPMIHIAGVTPESANADQHRRNQGSSFPEQNIALSDLQSSWFELNSATDNKVDLICFGNPHFSLTECAQLASLCKGKHKHATLEVIVTLGRAVHEAARAAGHVESMEQFGIQFVTDTCWCMLRAPVVPESANVLMTNSGKYAHYAPGLVSKKIKFDSMENCVLAASTGSHQSTIPQWMSSQDYP